MRLRLIGQKQAIFELADGGDYVLGRTPGANASERSIDVSAVDSDSKVSARHLKLSVKEGKVLLSDLGSTNGTYLLKLGSSSETKLEGEILAEASSGDKLLVGNLLFAVE